MTGPLTRAERTGWAETSRHRDVLAFLDALAAPALRRTSFGTSPEGRDLPLLVVSTRGVTTPEEARRAGLPVVLVLNGIHAGEVEGKEASLMLARDLLAGRHAGLLDRLTLLVVPLFNPDGNDRIDPSNRVLDLKARTGQLGPASGVGTRTNAAGINLNRDYMRQETAELRLLQSRVARAWAPDLTIDCHSTNGSVHRFDLTYDVPHTVESGPPGPIAFMRETFCPELGRRARANHGRETFFYGNFVEDEGGLPEHQGQGWMTYTHHPRFGSNYRGLGGGCDLLFEAYSYLPFEERVRTTYGLLLEALSIAAERGSELRQVVRDAGGRPPARVAVRYRLDRWAEPATILTREPRTLEGAPTQVTLPHLGRFVGERVVDRPRGYAVPEPVARHLELHGLKVTQLARPRPSVVEASIVASIREADARSILEAPGEVLIDATRERHDETLPAGAWLVEADQPNGAVAVYLCEAESDDGLIAASLMMRPAAGDRWPAVRVLA